MPGEKLYTAKEAAREYFQGKIGEAAVREFVRSGEIGSIPVGIRRFIPESELKAFFDRHKSQAAEQ